MKVLCVIAALRCALLAVLFYSALIYRTLCIHFVHSRAKRKQSVKVAKSKLAGGAMDHQHLLIKCINTA